MRVTAISTRAQEDKRRYHPADPAEYSGSVGLPCWDGYRWLYVCVGCWYCEGITGRDIIVDVEPDA